MNHFVPILVQFVQEPRSEKQNWNVARVQNGNTLITLLSQFNKNASDAGRDKIIISFTYLLHIIVSCSQKKKK